MSKKYGAVCVLRDFLISKLVFEFQISLNHLIPATSGLEFKSLKLLVNHYRDILKSYEILSKTQDFKYLSCKIGM